MCTEAKLVGGSEPTPSITSNPLRPVEDQCQLRKHKIALCICTYRRPEGLRRLLSHLAQLRFDSILEPDIEIIVVENDSDEYARLICEEYQATLAWPLRYDLEVNPGISHARNRCLHLAAEHDAAFIAFLDDDEMPRPGWLEALLQAQRTYDADVVGGPVVGIYDRPAPTWVTDNPFLRLRSEQSGTLVDECSTNNVLFSTTLITRDRLKFEEAMGLCGGEDALFFLSARRKGARLVWCGEAVVEETVPAERTTLLWVLRRAFRIGISKHKCAYHLDGRLSALAQSLWFGSTRMGAGLISLPFAVALGPYDSVTALCRMAFGAGCILGAAGCNFNAYRPKVRRSPILEAPH
jgi:glycosyltransferase involved in cell wall biosynthesis